METNCARYFVSLVCLALAASSETANDTSLENCGQKSGWSVYMDVAADVISKAKNTSITCHETDENCGQKEALMSYLQVADEMINKARINFPTCENCNVSQQQVLDCSDLLHMGHNRSGVYTISPLRRLTGKKSVKVYCDMETDGGGWTVIQRRGEFQNPVDYFYKDWKSYKEGFGDVEKEFWLGNDNIFALTNQGIYSVRFDLEDFVNNTAYAQYETFWIDDETSKYTLHIANYSGNAGDSMMYHNNQKFSTKDQDNDSDNDEHCAVRSKGAWWFKTCLSVHLNGIKLKGIQKGTNDGLIWRDWKGVRESLASSEIKIRPKNIKAYIRNAAACLSPM